MSRFRADQLRQLPAHGIVSVMDISNKTALLGVGFGLAVSLAAMAGPLASPNAPIWVWQIIFWLGILGAELFGVWLVCEHFFKKKTKNIILTIMIPSAILVTMSRLFWNGPVEYAAKIEWSQNQNVVDVVALPKTISEYSTAQLREAVVTLTKRMREQQARYKAEQSAAYTYLPENSAENAAPGQARAKMNQALADAENKQNYMWQTDFLPHSRELLNEMARRLCITIPTHYTQGQPEGLIYLQDGFLTGPTPLAELSNMLDDYSRQLAERGRIC